MKEAAGTVTFVVCGLLVFRFTYGAWPPTEGNFAEWFLRDAGARWALLWGVMGGIVGALTVRVALE